MSKDYRQLDNSCGVKELDDFDIVACLTKGSEKRQSDRPTSPGQLRGGSTGAIIDNNVHGVCHRKAYLRFMGIETPLKTPVTLMTDQGCMNEVLWLDELRTKGALPAHHYALNQTQFDCTWRTKDGDEGSGSPDIVITKRDPTKSKSKKHIWIPEADTMVRGLENKNISSISTAKSAHYELRPNENHIIQAANYSIRMGQAYNGGKPLPYQLVYSSRVIWHFFAMSEKNKKVILDKGWDINWMFGRPMSILPFHRTYTLDWNPDGSLRYWTPGMKQWVTTQVSQESIDKYYEVVSQSIDSERNLGPRPTLKHVDGRSAYSPCSYCDFNSVCDLDEDMAPQEFIDRCKVLAAELWDNL